MKLTYSGSAQWEIEIADKSDFYPVVAKEITTAEYGKSIVVTASTEDGFVTYKVGMRSGAQTIFEQKNTMPEAYLSGLKPAYLTCVEPEVVEYLRYLEAHPEELNEATFLDEISKRCKNSYKQYKLIPGNGKVTVYYGRMAVQKGEAFGERAMKYSLASYWTKYFEMIGKGYIDRTAMYMPETIDKRTPTVPSENAQPRKDTSRRSNAALLKASQKLFQRLKKLAKHAVDAAEVKVPITPEIIDFARRQIDAMRNASEANNIVAFNLALFEIISVLQRPVTTGDGTGVRRMLAISRSDFAQVIEREEDLLQAMEGSIAGDSCASVKAKEDFSAFGIEVYEATSSQADEVLRHLTPTLRAKVKAVYRVIPARQKDLFNRYLRRHNIENVKMLWHGSRNENWLSIIQNSLVLNPNAIITGKMFGKGIYFAPSSMKSWNYTSYRGTTWANGRSDCAYMGLYAVAYGKPYDVHTHSSLTDYRKIVQNGPYDCLHAHAGTSLLADEIVFYNEAAILLNYIVEFGD